MLYLQDFIQISLVFTILLVGYWHLDCERVFKGPTFCKTWTIFYLINEGFTEIYKIITIKA